MEKFCQSNGLRKDGRPVSVNGDQNLALLENFWRFVSLKAQLESLWFRKDVTPSQSTNRDLSFLNT